MSNNITNLERAIIAVQTPGTELNAVVLQVAEESGVDAAKILAHAVAEMERSLSAARIHASLEAGDDATDAIVAHIDKYLPEEREAFYGRILEASGLKPVTGLQDARGRPVYSGAELAEAFGADVEDFKHLACASYPTHGIN